MGTGEAITQRLHGAAARIANVKTEALQRPSEELAQVLTAR
jgi:hypothetical protein